MENHNLQSAKAQPGKVRDIPHLIKWIILIFLIMLFFVELRSGEYNRLSEQRNIWIWIVLFLKIILIIGVIILMWVQRRLRCEILTPNGCTEELQDGTLGILFVKVTGTASGSVFGQYTIEIQRGSDPPYPGIVSYPGGGSAGGSPVINGELATINTTALSDGAYTITLRVFTAGPGTPHVCTKTFNLLKVAVWINSIGGVAPTPNIFDEDATLMSGANELSFGGSLEVLGSAYIYECDDRKVKQVEMRYALIPFGGPMPMQPANLTPVPPAWPVGNQLASPLVYDPSKYYFWTRIGAAPTRLLNSWGTCTIGATTYPSLQGQNWQSRGATGGSADGGAYLKLLLSTEDTSGKVYYDTQKVWIDNHRVQAGIIKFQREINGVWTDLPNCTDVMISWKKLRIIGLAWDALIDPLYPATRPNDNFNGYNMYIAKQFVPGSIAIVSGATSRVPDAVSFPLTTGLVPGPGNAALLAEWDLSVLDAGAATIPGTCSNPVGNEHTLFRGCECTYIMTLSVSDFTVGPESSVHNPYDFEAVKIINDL